MNRGRLVQQDDLDTLRALTGRSIVRTPDTDRAREVLDGQIELAQAAGWSSRTPDTAALNSRLVAPGCGSPRSPPSGGRWRTWCCR